MRQWIRSHLTYANVMVTLLAFVILGGGAYAAFQLPKNSVRSPNIVNGQVKKKDIGAPLRFKSALLGTTCEGTEWINASPNLANHAAYARDAYGVVHLRGLVSKCGSPQSN